MASYTPVLNLPQVAPNQNQKEATINTALAILEAASNDVESIDLSAGAVTLTTDQFTKYFLQKLINAAAAVVVTIPNTPRYFAVQNAGTFPVQLLILGGSGSGSTLTVPAGVLSLVMTDGTTISTVSSGVSRLQDLSDVAAAANASSGQVLGYESATGYWTPVDLPADLSVTANTIGAADVVVRHIFTRNALYYSDFTQSLGVLTTAPTSAAVFSVYKNATIVGTISFAAGATTSTFSTNTGSGSTTLTVAPGDVLSIKAPASADATMAGLTLTLKGVYT